MFKLFLYKLGIFVLNHFSISTSYKFAAVISDVQYFFSFRDRKAVQNNLKVILPDSSDVPFHAREVFRNFGRYLVEFFKTSEIIDDDFIKNRVQISGAQHLECALKGGKGGIIVSAHIGNWELGAMLVSMLGYPLMAVALPHKERPVNDLFNQRREAKGITVVPMNMAIRRCTEQLKENKFIALVADRDFSNHGFEMDFLGRKMLIPKGPAMFSWKTGAPIIPVFLVRGENGNFIMTCCKPIDPPSKNTPLSEDEVVLGIMRRYVPIIEEQIRACPSQWLLFRELFI